MIPALLAMAGCVGECTGPACEDAYPASRVVVMGRDDLVDEENVLQFPDRIQGALADGGDWSVAAADGRLVIGMPGRREVLLMAPPTGAEPVADLVIARVGVDEPGFGTAVAVADTDGDGDLELWVGAPGADGGRGAIHRFPDIDALGVPDLRITGQIPADAVGSRIMACEDVTGDGHADLAISATSWSAPTDWPEDVPDLAGGVWLWRSEQLRAIDREDPPALPWDLGPTWWGEANGDAVGRALVCDADLTGDGLADLAIGAPFAGPSDPGRVYIRTASEGLESGVLTDADPWTLVPGPDTEGWFGSALVTRTAVQQIVDDTVIVDLVVGAAGYDRGRGRVAVFRDRLPVGSVEDAWFTNPRDEPDHFGRGLAAGDLDGDGLEELFIGAPEWRERRGTGDARTRYDTGRAWIWEGSGRFRWTTEGFEPPSDFEIRGSQPFLAIGVGAQFVDLTGDGFDELVQPIRAPDPTQN
jgi:hypothetical protein